MLEAGVHFGTRRALLNPKMAPFIFALTKSILLTLEQTVVKYAEAVEIRAFDRREKRQPSCSLVPSVLPAISRSADTSKPHVVACLS